LFSGLHTYPLRCWVSAAAAAKQSASDVEFARRYFIEDGCPSADDNSLLSSLEQKTGPGRYAEWTKLTVPITRNLVSTSLLNGIADIGDGPSSHLTFRGDGRCPRASFCSPAAAEGRRWPAWLEPYLQHAVTVTLGNPIRILLANASEPSLDNDDTSVSDEMVAESDDKPISAAYGQYCL
uniref:COesterase domain-containing protein n=1 Tax=Gongylonema pulchrum TaxID=637853 RepID=A0A183EAE8_9BILA